MTSPFQKAVESAFKVFSRRNGASVTSDSLSELRTNLNKVTKDELRIDPHVLEDKIPKEHEAPVTYIRILEDKLMTIAVFVLRQGKSLPLHDHPGMFGLLKVIHGSVTIKTYTPLDPNKYPVPATLSETLADKYGRNIPVYPSWYEGDKVCTETDDCCVISPNNKNVHEIISESGTAAFLDVLSPPYNHKSMEDCRPCSYYKEISIDSKEPNIRYLVKIKSPPEYWCDEVDYYGPQLPLPS
ncbi:2-aminoethanethiol dioxygenase-like [Ruditapes philippinarum]|uniref:2-aminoethanethiol dioxygenase-like n=1 Tax=Ruditapes philippinarum TaxID=129788 RepID=UPI00295BCE64|nr:2-aminoethanethiol dioxygenase-like [Ruditapes philippinarum]